MNDDTIKLDIQFSPDEMRTLAASIKNYGSSIEQMLKSGLKPNDPRVELLKEAQPIVRSIDGKLCEFMNKTNFDVAMIYASTDA